MTQPSTPTAGQPSDDHSWARPLYEQQIALLGELAEAGMAVAMTISQQVKAGEGDLLTHAGAYDRVARAVRLAILLQSKLIKQLLDRDRQTASPTTSQDRREAEIARAAAERDREHAEHIERLVGQAGERLDQDDIYREVNSRPVSELIAMICRDIGLDPDWPRLAQEAWVHKEATGAAPGSPFAALAGLDVPTTGASPYRPPLGRPPGPH